MAVFHWGKTLWVCDACRQSIRETEAAPAYTYAVMRAESWACPCGFCGRVSKKDQDTLEFQTSIDESSRFTSPLPCLRAMGTRTRTEDQPPKRRGAVRALRAPAL